MLENINYNAKRLTDHRYGMKVNNVWARVRIFIWCTTNITIYPKSVSRCCERLSFKWCSETWIVQIALFVCWVFKLVHQNIISLVLFKTVGKYVFTIILNTKFKRYLIHRIFSQANMVILLLLLSMLIHTNFVLNFFPICFFSSTIKTQQNKNYSHGILFVRKAK